MCPNDQHSPPTALKAQRKATYRKQNHAYVHYVECVSLTFKKSTVAVHENTLAHDPITTEALW